MKVTFLSLLPLFLFSQIIDTIIPLYDEPRSLLFIPEKNKLYISFYGTHRLFVMDCSNYEIKKIIQIPSGPYGEGFGLYNWRRDKIYFGFNPFPESILVIDAKTDSIVKWINWDAYYPWGKCYHSKNDKLYVVNGSEIAVIDCETDSIIKIINHPQYYLSGFTLWDSIGDKVYCGSSWATIVGVINCERDSLIKIIPNIASSPCHPGYSRLQRKLYVAGAWGTYAGVICTKEDSVVKRYRNMRADDHVRIIYNEREDKIYWPGDDSISYIIKVIDCKTDSIIKNIRVGNLAMNWYLAEWSNRLYCVSTHWEDKNSYNILYILDCRNDSIISQLKFGRLVADFYGITGNPNTRQIYISDQFDSSLYVIRDEIVSIKEDNEENKTDISQKIKKSFLDTSFLEKLGEIEIYDISGKLVLRDRKDKVSLKRIKKGVYIVKIGKQKEIIKIIKL